MTCYIGHGCSIASFEKGELGEAIPETELPQHIRERVASPYMLAGPAAATPHLQPPLSASARMPLPPTHQASLPWRVHAYTALLIAQSHFIMSSACVRSTRSRQAQAECRPPDLLTAAMLSCSSNSKVQAPSKCIAASFVATLVNRSGWFRRDSFCQRRTT